MLVNVVNMHQHTINDPGDNRPTTRALTMLAMSSRTLVIRSWGCQHDHSITSLHLTMSQPAVSADDAIDERDEPARDDDGKAAADDHGGYKVGMLGPCPGAWK